MRSERAKLSLNTYQTMEHADASHMDPESQSLLILKVADCEDNIKKGFVRKVQIPGLRSGHVLCMSYDMQFMRMCQVYCILSVQILIAVATIAVFVLEKSAAHFAINNPIILCLSMQ